MMDGKRGTDAKDRAPQPTELQPHTPDEPRTVDEERSDSAAIEVEDLSSANDEGAN